MILSNPKTCRSSSSSSSTSSPSKYDLYSAVCLERLPLITPELNVIQSAMRDALHKHEIARSLYSDHEMKHFEDVRRAERLASKTGEIDEKDIENASKQSAQDFQDISLKELEEATFAGRRTKEENDKKSLNRWLDKRLLLLTKAHLSQSRPWLLPMAKHDMKKSDSLRSTAEQAIRDNLGEQFLPQIVFNGNSPTSVYSYRYPIKIRSSMDGKEGGRIFFFKAHVVNHKKFSKIEGIKNPDYLWLSRQEAKELILSEDNRRYWNRLEDGLLFESLGEDIADVIVKRVRRKLLSNQSNREEARSA